MPPAEPVLAAREVTRRFGHRRVLSGVSLELHPGDALLLVGPNGAGKTTLMRVISGLVPVRNGELRLDGQSLKGRRAHEIMAHG
ncbi:MAG: ATP-binding cassette domain-containing protein, partial [Gemmatimonadetes bacterium]|nr:ATP-binding cassette domain-containing protein [Gemmatimonadota bacterium]